MKTINISNAEISTLESYWSRLKNLSVGAKLELISRLSFLFCLQQKMYRIQKKGGLLDLQVAGRMNVRRMRLLMICVVPELLIEILNYEAISSRYMYLCISVSSEIWD